MSSLDLLSMLKRSETHYAEDFDFEDYDVSDSDEDLNDNTPPLEEFTWRIGLFLPIG